MTALCKTGYPGKNPKSWISLTRKQGKKPNAVYV